MLSRAPLLRFFLSQECESTARIPEAAINSTTISICEFTGHYGILLPHYVPCSSRHPAFLDYHVYVAKIFRWFVLEGGGVTACRLHFLHSSQGDAGLNDNVF
jgi:hypothetical protein